MAKRANKRPREQRGAVAPYRRPALSYSRTDSGSVGIWPEGTPMPETHRRATIHACEKCRAMTLNSGQAVIARGASKGLVYLECRVCGHQFRRRIESDIPECGA